MEVLIIHGSPRKGQHTDNALEAFMLHAADVQHHVYLYDDKIEYCKGCLYCGKKGICFIDDDMKKLYNLFETVDKIVFGTPMYFNSVSSAAKVMIDRTQVYWSRKYEMGTGITVKKEKKGAFILTAGVKHNKESIVAATKVAEIFFKAINCTYDVEIILDHIDKNPMISKDARLLEISEKGSKFFS